MARPIVIAYHLVWTGYGWWLPNDPRGSMSHCIRKDVLKEIGELHYGRKKLQPAGEETHRFYLEAERLLKHPLTLFGRDHVSIIAEAFDKAVKDLRYTCWACAIMPDHVHVLIRKHRDSAEKMIANLQAASHDALKHKGLFASDHPVWGGPGWKVFLDHPDELVANVACESLLRLTDALLVPDEWREV